MENWWIYVLLVGAMCFIAYKRMVKKSKVYRRLPDRDFPREWRAILQQRVPFYKRLSITEKKEFENQVHIFLLNYKVSGRDTKITDLDRVLVASGAVVPTFRLEKWHYVQLAEVVIFPDVFNIPTTNQMARGLVGWGEMHGQMWLSRKALYEGFHIDNDKKNVAIHEFIHLMDMQDGMVDGVLESLLDENDIEPWLQLVAEKSERMNPSTSSIRSYAKANPVEFLAATGEYYFESPDQLKREHPTLFSALDRMFNPNQNWF